MSKFVYKTLPRAQQRKITAALSRSIKDWKRYIDYPLAIGGNQCKLCETCWDISTHSLCEVCPVAAHTGKGGCRGTPFHAAANAHEMAYDILAFLVEEDCFGKKWSDAEAAIEDCRSRARDEVEFLESVLADCKKQKTR